MSKGLADLGTTVAAPDEAWFLNGSRPTYPLPKTVIDVGVGHGTPKLYRSYSDAFFLFVEPIIEFSSDIVEFLRDYNGSWVRAAASNEEGRQKIYIDINFPEMSSLSEREFNRRKDKTIEVRTVDTVRLDEIVRSRKLRGPFVIKSDVEGFDLNVLKGAEGLLSEVVFIIVECRLDRTFVDPNLNTVMHFLLSRGFVLENLLELKWEKLGGKLRWINAAFANEKFENSYYKIDVD